MFTGIVDHCGQIHKIEAQNHGKVMLIESRFTDIQAGESIAVNGICLTAVKPEAGIFSCDISPETLSLTSADQWQAGDSVNLERSLRADDRFGGHFVMGHVDHIATVSQITQEGDFFRYQFSGQINPALLAVKGSVAVNGVSLTINSVDKDSFSVMLVPHTLDITNLSDLHINHNVNIEYDYLARIIAQQLAEQVR